MEKPLLAIVLKELRRDLQSRQQRNRIIYMKSTTILGRERGRHGPHGGGSLGGGKTVRRQRASILPSTYTRDSNTIPRAIEILLDAHRREVLDEGGQSRLVELLRNQNRFAETISILEPLVNANRQFAISRVAHECLVQDRQARPARRLLKETHDYFHKDQRLD